MAREADDHFIFDGVKNPKSKTGWSPRVTAPSDVLYVPDKAELHQLLRLYANPFIRHTVPDSAFARRWHVEKVRPALRYYCKRFGVDVPSWLENDDKYRNLSDAEKRETFDTDKLVIKEFRPINRNHGVTRRKTAE